MAVFWDVILCNLVYSARRFRDAVIIKVITALKMETVSISEPLVNIYHNTRRNIPKDSRFHTRCHDKLKSHLDGIAL